MNLIKAIEIAQNKKEKRGYEYLYWCIDVHGVILEPTYTLNNDGAKPYKYALESLRLISNDKSNRIIMWTSSHEEILIDLIDWLKAEGIEIYRANCNPDYNMTDICDFTHKFYFDILLDDKAGFEPEKDWFDILNYLNEVYI